MKQFSVGQSSLLDELDARQNQVLADLDALNSKIELLLRQWTRSTAEASPASNGKRPPAVATPAAPLDIASLPVSAAEPA